MHRSFSGPLSAQRDPGEAQPLPHHAFRATAPAAAARQAAHGLQIVAWEGHSRGASQCEPAAMDPTGQPSGYFLAAYDPCKTGQPTP